MSSSADFHYQQLIVYLFDSIIFYINQFFFGPMFHFKTWLHPSISEIQNSEKNCCRAKIFITKATKNNFITCYYTFHFITTTFYVLINSFEKNRTLSQILFNSYNKRNFS